VAFSPDGKTLAFVTHGEECVIRLWDVREHREITRFPVEHMEGGFPEHGVPAMAFSPSGRQLAIGTKGGPIVLWDLATHTAALTLRGHSYDICCLVFSTDGQTLVTGSWDKAIRVWDLSTQRQVAILTNHTGYVQCVALSPDSKTIASGSWDKTVRIWDLTRQCQVAVLTNHTRWVAALAFSPDGKTLASASADCLIKLWDTRNWREVSTLKGSQNEVCGIVFSGDGKTLFSGTKDGQVLVWDARPHAPRAHVLRRPDSAQGFGLCTYGIPFCRHTNHTFNLWDPLTLRRLPEHPMPESGLWTNVVHFEFSPGGELLAFATRQGPLYLWSVERERQIACLAGWPSDRSVVGFSRNGKLLAAIAAGKGLKLWTLENFEEVAALPKSPATPYVNTLCFTIKGEAVAVGNMDGTVEVWDLHRKERVANWIAHKERVNGLAFMPDGKRLVSVSWDSTATLWELGTEPQPREIRSFGRTLNAFFCVAVSPDGQRIAAGTWGDMLIKIWNPTTGQEVATLKGANDWVGDPSLPGSSEAVASLTFLPPDGGTLISSTYHEVRLWRAPSWKEIATAEKETGWKTQQR
jgi:WD40 repeat protein